MSTASGELSRTATAEAVEWIPLRQISMMGLAPYQVLSDLAADGEPAPIGTDVPEMLTGDDGVCIHAIRSSALHKRLGHELAERVEAYKPVWGSISPADASAVGFSAQATAGEVLALAERRGVLTDGEQIDRKGFELLGKLLAEEKRIGRFLSRDCVRWNLALPHIERVMVSPVVLEVKPEPPPRVREPWETEPYHDPRKEGKRVTVRSDDGSLFVERCKVLGLDCNSVADGMGYANERWARMFELFCILGINPDATRMSGNRRLMPQYHAMQTRAFDTVVTSR
jgi:hypothetical protein